MISNTFNVGLSGLESSKKVIEMISQNIANANTPGFKRLEEHNEEVNFSGVDNKPFLPGGVNTTVSTLEASWVDKRMSDALHQYNEADAMAQGAEQLDSIMNDDTLSQSFTTFMTSSHQMQQFPEDPVVQQAFKDSGQNFTNQLNRVNRQLQGAVEDVGRMAKLNQIRLDSLQTRLEELAKVQSSQDVSSEINYIKQQISQVTGTINGYNRVLQEIIPPVMSTFGTAVQDVISGANDAFGSELISVNAQSTFQFNGSAVGNYQHLTEFGNQQFNKDLGTIKTMVGSLNSNLKVSAGFSQANVESSQQLYNDTYGVDLVEESVKMQQYQRMYEANAQVIKTADEMVGTLLNIFS